MIYIHNTNLSFKKYKITYHLIADNINELHSFAQKIGLKKQWFQNKSISHYDIFGSLIQKAKNLGAKELSNKEFVFKMKNQNFAINK